MNRSKNLPTIIYDLYMCNNHDLFEIKELFDLLCGNKMFVRHQLERSINFCTNIYFIVYFDRVYVVTLHYLDKENKHDCRINMFQISIKYTAYYANYSKLHCLFHLYIHQFSYSIEHLNIFSL